MGAGAIAFSGLASAIDAFYPYEAMPTGSSPEAVAIGDVNNDGKNDVVVTTSIFEDSHNNNQFAIFYQQPDGTLSLPIIRPTEDPEGADQGLPLTVGIGDMTGDGANDIIIGNDRQSIQVFKQESDGSFTQYQTIQTVYSSKIRLGYLNNDALLDVAGIASEAETENDSVAVFLQDGTDHMLSSVPILNSAPHGGNDDLELGDISGDGLTDIVVASGEFLANRNADVLVQNEGFANLFEPVIYYDLIFDTVTGGLGIGDVTSDGRADVVISYEGGGASPPPPNIAVFPPIENKDFEAAVISESAANPQALDVADVTGDGLADVVLLHGSSGLLGLYKQIPGGTLDTEEFYPIPSDATFNPHGLAIGDINSDGFPDVAIASPTMGLVTLLNTASPLDLAPTANAGPDKTAFQGMTVTLDGTASFDPEGDDISYSWAQVSGPDVVLTATETPGVVTFEVPSFNWRQRKTVFELTVTDALGKTSTADQVTVKTVPPLLSRLPAVLSGLVALLLRNSGGTAPPPVQCCL